MTEEIKARTRSDRKLPTFSFLRTSLDYDPEIGIFTWSSSYDRFKASKGGVAGYKTTLGYWSIMIDGSNYYAHRLAWLYVTGDWPIRRIDHKNCDKLDNRFLNLRLATPSQNMANMKKPKHNVSGLKGAHFSNRRGKWVAQIMHHKSHIFLGHFDSKEEAHAAYLAKANDLYGEFARAD